MVDEGVMNEVFPRCAVPGSSCRLLQLEAPGARPVWAVLDAAGTRHFTGEITLHCAPTVRAWFNGGELYYAERDGDAGLADRLLAMGVLGADDLAAGSVQLGAVTHLGRLFDRVPQLDRDHVELALEILTGEVVGEIADHVVEEITIASYRHHPSGVVKWQKRPTVVITQVAGDTDPTGATSSVTSTAMSAVAAPVAAPRHEPTPVAEPIDLVPTAEDEALVAEYEASLALPELDDPGHDVAPPVDHLAHDEDPDQEPDRELDQDITAVIDEPSSAATREQPVFDDLLLELEPAVDADHAADVAQPEIEAEFQPEVQPETQPETEAEFQPEVEPEVEGSVEDAADIHVETQVVEAQVVEAPVEAEDALAAFERSLSAQLDATFAQHFDQHFDQHLLTSQADAPEAPADEAQVPALQIPALPPIDHQHDEHVQPEPMDQPGPTEQTWAIDDRVDWHVDTAAPAAPSPAAPSLPDAPSASAVPTLGDGPVVEFDLQHLLQQHDADRAASSADSTGSTGSFTVAGIEVPEETDADIRAAVQAALAEIAAATRPNGDHEVPSILMQAALVADAETGLTPSPDLWDVAAPAASTPPPPPSAAPPIVPILPDRAPATPASAPLPPLPPSPGAPTSVDAGTDDTGSTGHDTGTEPEPARAAEPVAPPTGGLRRLMGSRKP